jgi:hypothetical protein
VRGLGIGAVVANSGLTARALARGLDEALQPAVADRAAEMTWRVSSEGAAIAARRLVEEFG